MRRPAAAALSAGFFVVAPGTVVGLIPWSITRWRVRRRLPGQVVVQVVGAVLIATGLVPAGSAFVEFVKAGGTPIPLAPTDRLVVSGFNRYVRNPMYLGLLTAVVGQALIFGNVRLLLYAAAVWVAPAAFVHWYEEPTLARQFGEDYEAYRRAVPAWWPRTRPWSPVLSPRPPLGDERAEC
jgi:protein-S-isoprenylcysteine O-methyltransferase Ste14